MGVDEIEDLNQPHLVFLAETTKSLKCCKSCIFARRFAGGG